MPRKKKGVATVEGRRGRALKPRPRSDLKVYKPLRGKMLEKMDTERIKTIIKILSLDGTKHEACTQAGISQTTFDRWYESLLRFEWEFPYTDDDGKQQFGKKIVTFKELVDLAITKPYMLARMSMFKWMKNSPRLAMDWLEKRDERYKANPEVNREGKININFGVQNQFIKVENE